MDTPRDKVALEVLWSLMPAALESALEEGWHLIVLAAKLTVMPRPGSKLRLGDVIDLVRRKFRGRGVILDNLGNLLMPRVIGEWMWHADQSWRYKVLVATCRKDRLEVHVRRDAYDYQSFARVDRWDGDEWQMVTSWPIENCECRAVSYVTREPDICLFRRVAAGLLVEARAILDQ